MNGKIYVLLFFNFSCASCSSAVNGTKDTNFRNGPVELEESVLEDNSLDDKFFFDKHQPMNSTFYKSVKRYYCSANNVDADSYLLVYGTKSWTFPEQTVNLTLTYPPVNGSLPESGEYVITALKVILYMDGTRSSGYITSGGILQDFISMSFVCDNITLLSYQFWLHGVPKTSAHIPEQHNLYYLC